MRADLLPHGVPPVIPPRKGRKAPAPLDRDLYRERDRIERPVGRLKENRRPAARYEKTADASLAVLDLAAVRLWIGFVNKAWHRAPHMRRAHGWARFSKTLVCGRDGAGRREGWVN